MKSAEYETMFRMEEFHWWYKALHRWIFWGLARYLPDWRDRDILDAGCGTGAVLQQLANPTKHVGVDLASEAIGFCRQRGIQNVRQADIMSLPFSDETFDAVVCSSVLYHRWVTDVPHALKELHRVLRPEGVLILNLPACKFLRSAHDEAVFTAQRFTKSEVRSLLQACRFDICKLTCWTSLLFPVAVMARTLRLAKNGRDFDTGTTAGFHNRLFGWLMDLEFRLLQCVSMPLGVALFCVARKSANTAFFEAKSQGVRMDRGAPNRT